MDWIQLSFLERNSRSIFLIESFFGSAQQGTAVIPFTKAYQRVFKELGDENTLGL